MKKRIALFTILAFSVASIAEARGVRTARSVTGKAISAPSATKAQTQARTQQNTQKDATFNNTASQPQAQQQASGNRMASFATGAAAGYVLSEMLSPTQAQANQATQPAQQTAETVATATASTQASVMQFKSIGGQIDPYLIEKTDGYRRYCISGVQYLIPAQGSQAMPVVMVNPNGKPLECQIVQ